MTTRRLIIMRHAKAEGHGEKPDFERELVQRGWDDAAAVGEQMIEHRYAPDRILVSTSRRTRDTLSAVMPILAGNCTIELRDALYDADVADLRDAVRTVAGQTVLVIGHNPAVHQLALYFAGSAAPAPLNSGFPTSTAAVFSFGFAIDTMRFERLISP